MKPLLFLVGLFFASITYGQNNKLPQWTYIPLDSTKQKWGDWDQPEWLRYFGLDFTDVNRDGLLDVVSGRYLYLNPGGDMTDPWERIMFDDNVDAILAMDVDGDAFADIIAQSLPEVVWLEAVNEEGTVFQSRIIANVPATSHVNSQGFEKAQIVSGGKEEILIAGNGNIYCIVVPEASEREALWPTFLICRNTSDEGIGVGDIDGDGDLDIACGRRPDGEGEPLLAVWYENPGTVFQEWESSFVSPSAHPLDRFKIADLNGDGQVEIIATEERYPGLEPDGNMYWFSATEDLKGAWEKHIIVTQYSMNNLDIADIDEDGDIDLITNEHKGPDLELQIWENDGQASFTKRIIDTGKENHLGTMFIDIDGDGDLDIVGAAWDHYRWMHLWRNDGSAYKSSLYREYKWVPEEQLIGKSFLRVGGKIDYRKEQGIFKAGVMADGNIMMFEDLDLKGAVGAELVLEKVQSHNDTKGLRVSINNNEWIPVHFPATIEQDPSQYMVHFSPSVPVPLDHLKQGSTGIKLEVDPDQEWGWPQNIFYGITLRIYYDMSNTRYDYKIKGIRENGNIGKDQIIGLETEQHDLVDHVEYIGFYTDVNWQGDGVFRQWQYNLHNTGIRNHIGTAIEQPFRVTWANEWMPDQEQPIKVKARVVLKNGMIFETEPVSGLQLQRDHSVRLAKPYQVPQNWVTRNQLYTEKLFIQADRKDIKEAKLYWRSWSPGYAEGILVNGALVKYENDWPHYDYKEHILDLDPDYLQAGENSISTLKTALHGGQMVHGMEVQWPGIQLKLKYESSGDKNPGFTFEEVLYEGREHYRIQKGQVTYYYDIAGGGFSRLIDRDGNDWISFKMKPWGSYPEAAASSFRGIPNLVFSGEDAGAGHPGHNKCRSRIEGDKLITEAISGNWEWQWSFNEDYAVLEVLKVPEGERYWVLYEGTPGGSFVPGNYTFGTSSMKPTSELNDYFKGKTEFTRFRWFYVSSSNTVNTFFMAQVQNDRHTDLYGFLGNTEDGLSSPDGMTVVGFGRGKDTNPLLTKPNKFIFGFYPEQVKNSNSFGGLSKYLEFLLKKQE